MSGILKVAIAEALAKKGLQDYAEHLQKNGDVFEISASDYELMCRDFLPFARHPAGTDCNDISLKVNEGGYETPEEALAAGEAAMDDWYREQGYTVGVSPPYAGIVHGYTPGRHGQETIAASKSHWDLQWELDRL